MYRTDCCFSPDDQLLVTGISVKKGHGNAKLLFFDRETFKKMYEIDVTDAVSQSSVYHLFYCCMRMIVISQDDEF